MVKKLRTSSINVPPAEHVTADVIVLGCSLPGIVVAHKLRRKFGDSMEIVVLDLAQPTRHSSAYNVAFTGVNDDGQPPVSHSSDALTDEDSATDTTPAENNIDRRFLNRFAREFQIPLPAAIVAPRCCSEPLNKLFQHRNGSAVPCDSDYHDFTFLSWMERFELNQYQRLLEHCTAQLFRSGRRALPGDTSTLLYYDRTSMEQHLCRALLFPTSREVMRLTVRLVCGAESSTVSVLFYLHQCHRTGSASNHLSGDNVELREKLLGYCRKRLAHKLQQSVADITLRAKPIAQIRSYPDERVILETIKGETHYVCNLLAMALRPDELRAIGVEAHLAGGGLEAVNAMQQGQARKFLVQYENNFWRRDGFSGDILSVRGPILWAMERPKLSTTGSLEKYSGLVGYLRVGQAGSASSRSAVLEQLVKLFGPKAATPVNYRETDLEDVYVPRCGDYVALRKLRNQNRREGSAGYEGGERRLEWAALDVFGEGDVSAALAAGHAAYLHVLRALRPQAQTFDDVAAGSTRLERAHLPHVLMHVNYVSGVRLLATSALVYIGIRVARAYFRN